MSVSGVMQCAIDYPHRYLGFIAWCVVSNRVGTDLARKDLTLASKGPQDAQGQELLL